MTKASAVSLGDLAWKVLVPLISGISLFLLNSIAADIRDLRSEIKSIRSDIQEVSIDQAAMKTRLDYYEKKVQ
jgi:hypothetical protein